LQEAVLTGQVHNRAVARLLNVRMAAAV